MLFTEGRTVHHKEYKTTGRQFFPINKVAILINNGTASAAEIVAGAVQDYDRGIIIGQRSFGKGLVQEPYILRDGSELRLSVARYYTPSGRCIQRPYRGKSRKEYISEGKSDSLFNAALAQMQGHFILECLYTKKMLVRQWFYPYNLYITNINEIGVNEGFDAWVGITSS